MSLVFLFCADSRYIFYLAKPTILIVADHMV